MTNPPHAKQLHHSFPALRLRILAIFRIPPTKRRQRLSVAEVATDLNQCPTSTELGTPRECTFFCCGPSLLSCSRRSSARKAITCADGPAAERSHAFGNCCLNSRINTPARQSCTLVQWHSSLHPESVQIDLLKPWSLSRCSRNCSIAEFLPCCLTL